MKSQLSLTVVVAYPPAQTNVYFYSIRSTQPISISSDSVHLLEEIPFNVNVMRSHQQSLRIGCKKLITLRKLLRSQFDFGRLMQSSGDSALEISKISK